MAKVKEKPQKPGYLTMNLFAPGMSALHRAGLGGLACTLNTMERLHKNGLLKKDKLPAPFKDGKPPWVIDEQNVTLHFGKPEAAEEYLRKLFEFAFTVGDNDGLIRLPGQYENEPSSSVLADLQAGLTLTFLQHGKVRQLAKEPTTATYDPEGEGPGVVVEYRKCSGFKHQDGWRAFIDNKGCLTDDSIKVDGPISPGSVVRHVAFTGDTAAEDPPHRMLPLYFALVGCLPLAVNRGVAALIVPEVQDLLEFTFDRPAMTPTTPRETQIANAADGALQAQRRLWRRDNPIRQSHVQSRARKAVQGSAIPGCYAMTFTPTPWASQQKSRVATIHVPSNDETMLKRFDRAMAHLPPRIVVRTVKKTMGRGKQKVTTERPESFRADSIVRPLIAENLATGRPWYDGFVNLMTKIDPATGKPFRNQLAFERKGLHDMIADDTMWDAASERTIVQAVHEALRRRYAQIADENKGKKVAMKNRFAGEYDRWRLAFSGSKTCDQFSTALCDLFSRAGRNSVLQSEWQQVLPMLRPANWQHARNLALIGLCSYQGRSEAEATDTAETK